MADEIKRCRAGTRGAVTKRIQSLKEAIDNCAHDEVAAGVERLQGLRQKLEKLDEKLLPLLDGDEVEEDIERAEQYIDSIVLVLQQAKTFLNCNNTTDSPGESNSSHVSLPKLNLPSFGGDIMEWLSFQDAFENMIISNKKLKNIDRFNYLKSQLKGVAADAVAGVLVTDANFTTAWDILKQRFGRKSVIIRAHIKHLLNLPQIIELNINKLRKFLTSVEVNVRGLASLGVTTDAYSIFLIQIILYRLPEEINRSWFRHDSNDDLGVDDFIKFLSRELVVYEHSDEFTSGQKSKSQSSGFSKPGISQTKVFTINNSNCKMCDKPYHKPNDCRYFMQLKPFSRYELIKQKRLCFRCFGDHLLTNCPHNFLCHCKKPHNKLLHYSTEKSSNDQSDVTIKMSLSNELNFLPIIKVPILTTHGVYDVKTLLDSGSQNTFINPEIVSRINYKTVASKRMKISCFGSHRISQCKIISFTSPLPNKSSININAIVDSKFTCNYSLNHEQFNKILDKQFHLKLSCCDTKDIGMIIGADHFWDFVTGETKKLTTGLRAINTVHGWTIHGRHSGGMNSDDEDESLCSFVETKEDSSTDIAKFWSLESIGLQDESSCPNEVALIHNHTNTLQYSDMRYFVQFPWVADRALCSNYFFESQLRLKNTLKTLVRCNLLQQYDAVLREYLKLGIIERVAEHGKVESRYIPHHPVVKDVGEKRKLRIVFDGSAAGKGEISLNDCMHAGPNLLPSLVGILCRFRLYRVAFCFDIEKAFLQIGLQESERCYTRFLWFENNLEENKLPTNEPVSFQFARVPFGLRSSPFLLNATIAFHLEKCNQRYPVACNLLKENMYVDDFIASVSSVAEKDSISSQAIEIFKQMGMSIHKEKGNLDKGITSVLGLSWQTDIDSFIFNIKVPIINTKREFVSFIGSLYDPLGFLSPWTISLKILCQDVWRSNIDWDKNLPDQFIKSLSQLHHRFNQIDTIKVPRGFFIESASIIDLIGYCDASNRAICCVFYIVVNNVSHLLIAKTRLLPINGLTIPRAELTAAFYLTKLLKTIKHELSVVKFNSIRLFSDSQVTLSWIKSPLSHKDVFVRNRVQSIKGLSSDKQWHFVPSENNPADCGTKFKTNFNAAAVTFWLSGGDHSLPIEAHHDESAKELEEECVTVLSSSTKKGSFPLMPSDLIDIGRFSKLSRCLRSICFVIRFCKRRNDELELSVEELERAKSIVIQQDQNQWFPEERSALLAGDPVHKSSKIFNLDPFIDNNGTMRSRSRLSDSNLSYNQRFPTILHSQSHLLLLILQDLHTDHYHAGLNFMLCEARKSYIFCKMRATIKRFINQCLKCRRYKLKPSSKPFAPLPPDRINDSARPFLNIGIDYFGPIVIPSRTNKLYVLLICCLQSRALHLELTESMSLDDFLKAMIRFQSRRGVPLLIRSDNARTFLSASKILEQKHNLTWKFSTPRAPWTGGVWERLVRVVKDCLKFAIRGKMVSFVDLETSLCKIESIVNQRPLTYVNTIDDQVAPLTPLMGLIPSANLATSPSEEAFDRKALLNCFDRNSALVRKFWQRWKNEYLSFLARGCPVNNTKNLSPGDVVLLGENAKREYWPLAKVLECFTGRDGNIRSVVLKCQGKVMRRPTKLCYNLEIN